MYLLAKRKRSQTEGPNSTIENGETVIKDTEALSRKAVLDLLSGPFRSHQKCLYFLPGPRIPWEGALIFRRLILVVAFTFIPDSRVRMMIILTICLLILVSHLYIKPFRNAMENFFETLSLTTIIILSGFSLVKTLYHGEDNSFLSSSTELLKKFDLTESILILAPATFVVLVAAFSTLMKLVFLVSFCLSSVYRKLRMLA